MQAPILQMLNGAKSPQAGNLAQIKQFVTKLRSMGSPQAALQQLMQQNNPQLAQAMELVKQHGGNPKAAFEALAKERGIDPSEIAELMK